MVTSLDARLIGFLFPIGVEVKIAGQAGLRRSGD